MLLLVETFLIRVVNICLDNLLYNKVTLALGMIMGLIFMAGLYNGAMYYYNKDKSFLYYMFMQFSITLVLFNMIGIINFTELDIARSETYYSLCSLISILFTTLFTKSFLETKTYSPKLNLMLNLFILMIFIDAIFAINVALLCLSIVLFLNHQVG